MKKILIYIFVMVIILYPSISYADDNLISGAKSAIIIEPTSGEILYKLDVNKKFAPASMTKMMSLLLVMDLVDSGKIKMDDEVTVSENAASMGGSQIFLEQNEKMKVSDLIKGVCISSANDAIVALAEYSYGSEEKFVSKMNEKVKELGLKNTNFKNVHGLDEANHYSSAYDMAMIAKELIKHEDILSYSSIYEDYLRKDTDKQVWLVNTNKLVKYYTGADGLKTGYTDEAGYCLTATAKRDGMRIITVVMGEESSKLRNSETIKLLDYGFNSYELDTILSKEKKLDKIPISKGTKDKISVSLVDDVTVLNKKGEDKLESSYEIMINNIKLPIKKGDTVGKIKLSVKGLDDKYVDIVSNENVDKQNIFMLYLNNLLKLVSGDIDL